MQIWQHRQKIFDKRSKSFRSMSESHKRNTFSIEKNVSPSDVSMENVECKFESSAWIMSQNVKKFFAQALIMLKSIFLEKNILN